MVILGQLLVRAIEVGLVHDLGRVLGEVGAFRHCGGGGGGDVDGEGGGRDGWECIDVVLLILRH